jgi:hypothetical protein
MRLQKKCPVKAVFFIAMATQNLRCLYVLVDKDTCMLRSSVVSILHRILLTRRNKLRYMDRSCSMNSTDVKLYLDNLTPLFILSYIYIYNYYPTFMDQT